MGELMSTFFGGDYPQFLQDAPKEVEERLANAIDLIRDRRLPIGKWHPTGFATFDIARIEGLGVMRLHFWPVGIRRELVGHPKIHKHCFQLYSRIVAGTYRESLYETREVTDDLSDTVETRHSRKRKFKVDTTVKDGVDRLVDTGRWVDVKPLATGLRFARGTCHQVKVGQFHSTPIPKNDFCITLALLSLPVPGAEDVLLGSRNFKLLTHRRKVLTEEDTEMLYEEYADYRKKAPVEPENLN
jgi:hypothetical protein